MKPRLPKGVTLIELMITVAIITIILSLAIVTMSGYIPKQRLVTTQGLLADIFQRAQTEANARSFYTCVKFSGTTPREATIYVDKTSTTGDHGTAGSEAYTRCGDAADILITKMVFKEGVDLASTTNCTNNILYTCPIWFDTTGSPKLCPTTTGCGAAANASVPASGCTDWSYEIVLSTPRLETGTRAREIEALAGGLVQIVKPLEAGLGGHLSAKSEANPGGCE